MPGARESPVMAVEIGKWANHMKNINEFDAEALRTVSYGFFAASFFGTGNAVLRLFFLFLGVAMYALARYVLTYKAKG